MPAQAVASINGTGVVLRREKRPTSPGATSGGQRNGHCLLRLRELLEGFGHDLDYARVANLFTDGLGLVQQCRGLLDLAQASIGEAEGGSGSEMDSTGRESTPAYRLVKLEVGLRPSYLIR